MTAYEGFQVCHSSVPGVLAPSVYHPQTVFSMQLAAENIFPLFQQLSLEIILLYAQSTTDSAMMMVVDILSAERGEIE